MSNFCKDCAIRLYNTKHHNLQGVGNPWSGKCIVVPNVDYDAYKSGSMSFSEQVKVIEYVLLSSTGVEYSDLFVVPLIRCNEHISCKLDDASYKKCLNYFAEDVKKYDFKDIILLGDAGRRFLSIDITPYLNTVFISPNNRRYTVNYSPFIKHIDQTKFEVFKLGIRKWYYSAEFNSFTGYDIVKL